MGDVYDGSGTQPEEMKRQLQNAINEPIKSQSFLNQKNRQSLAIHLGKCDDFIEDRSEDDVMEYPRVGSDPGLVVIFNHETFENQTDRLGTRRDVEELIITLSRLKFNIDANFIFNDLTEAEIKNTIKEICSMDLKERNCLICIFLSHGDSRNRLSVKDGEIDAESIYMPFTKCADLEGKPKLFIYQACKTSSLSSNVINESENNSKELVHERTLNMNIPKDLLLFYSTLEGELSFRNEVYGSWFIQELCRNFNGYGRRDDVVSLIMRTTKCVGSNYVLEKQEFSRERNGMIIERHKQLPIFISTLTKKFYLTKSKDRVMQLQLKKRIAELNRTVEDLCAKLSQ